mmetsp:Transcript_10789/g.9242  ORF Transcript_10789/g.9242 Transcript_10789/m.9242 type:complete len:219 (+) Transcript_10789:71-727(+)
MRIQYNTARDQLFELRERIDNSKKESSRKIAELQLSNEVADEKKRRLAEDFEYLNTKFVSTETKNTNLQSENIKLQTSLNDSTAQMNKVDKDVKNRKATFASNETELLQLRTTNFKLLHEKIELESQLENEIQDRKKWEEKSGILKSQLDQESSTNEMLKKKLSNGLTGNNVKAFIKEDSNAQNKDFFKEGIKAASDSNNYANSDNNGKYNHKFANEE